MSDASETFFTSIGCMDGRVQDPVVNYGRNKFGAKFADTITEAGLVGKLQSEGDLFESIKAKALISLGKHHSKGIIVHGHQECAGNPVDDEKHKQDILNAANIIKSMAGSVPVIPVFVKRENESWTVEELSSTASV